MDKIFGNTFSDPFTYRLWAVLCFILAIVSLFNDKYQYMPLVGISVLHFGMAELISQKQNQ